MPLSVNTQKWYLLLTYKIKCGLYLELNIPLICTDGTTLPQY